MDSAVTSSRSVSLRWLILIGIIFLLLLTVFFAYSGARKKSRDLIRVGDIQAIQQFLESYKTNNGFYPLASGQNQPLDWEKYLDNFPSASIPPDGRCNNLQNQFQYSTLNQNQSYRIKFCLGSAVGKWQAGLNTARP